jgi:hypothetical protein
MEDLSNKEMFTMLINELQKVSNSVSSLSSRMDNLESSKSIHSMNSSKLKESNLDLSVDDDNNFKSFNDDTNEVQNLYRVAIKPDGLCGVHSINKMIVNNKDKELILYLSKAIFDSNRNNMDIIGWASKMGSKMGIERKDYDYLLNLPLKEIIEKFEN